MQTDIDTLIVGGGQAGLALSYYLSQRGHEHLVLEKGAQPAETWRSRRWDSFTLVTPNWSFLLPGAEYDGPDPHAFMPRDEIIRRFERYQSANRLPVRYSTEVQSAAALEDQDRFRVQTQDAVYTARRVVVATGLYQKVRVLPQAAGFPAHLHQLDATHYRRPDLLPPGAVLVVGSGQSGCQIAEELREAGREVYLSTGVTGRFPRRYRGKDIFEWAHLTGFLDRTPDQLPSPLARFAPLPHLTGKHGGHTINLHQFHRDGIHLLGHLAGVQDGILRLAGDLHENLARSDKFSKDFLTMMDALIAKTGLDAPPETLEERADAYAAPDLRALDLRDRGITAVIWASGFSFDFSAFHDLPLDAYGYPITDRGVTARKGLYVLGLPWQYKQKSGLLLGVGEDAAFLAEHICARA